MNKNEIEFTFDVKKLDKFRSCLLDLSKTNRVVKIKIKGDDMLMYSAEESGTTILAFKSHTFPISEFFTIIKDELTKEDNYVDEFDDGMSDNKEPILELDWIIGDVKLFYNKLSFFDQKDIRGKFEIQERNGVKQISKIGLTDDRYTFTLFSSEAHIVRDIPLDNLNKLLNPENAGLKLTFSTDELNSAKRASTIDTDDVICIQAHKDTIRIKQNSWSLIVGKTEESINKRSFCFHKKYLKSINPTDVDVNIWCFTSFILYQEGSERFMVSYEQDY